MRKVLMAIVVVTLAVPAFAGKHFSYFRIRNPDDVVTTTTAGTVLMGGSTDVDVAFQWLCDRQRWRRLSGNSRDRNRCL